MLMPRVLRSKALSKLKTIPRQASLAKFTREGGGDGEQRRYSNLQLFCDWHWRILTARAALKAQKNHPSLLMLENLHLVSHVPVQPKHAEVSDEDQEFLTISNKD